MLGFFSVKLRRFGGVSEAGAASRNPEPAKTRRTHLVLTMKEESCYILIVPRVKIGLPVFAFAAGSVDGGGVPLSVAAFALTA
jgi:hypothetical protein